MEQYPSFLAESYFRYSFFKKNSFTFTISWEHIIKRKKIAAVFKIRQKQYSVVSPRGEDALECTTSLALLV